jgi:hypothetical protein
VYETRSFKKLYNWMSTEERKEYMVDISEIDQNKYIQLNNYGIQKYILKENA